MVDNSDAQYAGFRDNVPYLFIMMAVHPLLRRLFSNIYPASGRTSENFQKEAANGSPSPRTVGFKTANNRLEQRISFDVVFSVLFLVALHGFSAAKVLLILTVNYMLATRLKKEYVPIATWVFNVGILFANELGQGYPYETIANGLFPWPTAQAGIEKEKSMHNWGTFFDSYGGLIPRWEVLFNITVLRLISFNFDHYWSLGRGGSSPLEVCMPTSDRVHIMYPVLMVTRRSNSTLETYWREIGSIYLPHLKITLFAITSPIHYIPLFISLDQS